MRDQRCGPRPSQGQKEAAEEAQSLVSLEKTEDQSHPLIAPTLKHPSPGLLHSHPRFQALIRCVLGTLGVVLPSSIFDHVPPVTSTLECLPELLCL